MKNTAHHHSFSKDYQHQVKRTQRWKRTLLGDPVEYDLRPYLKILEEVDRAGKRLPSLSDPQLRENAVEIRQRALQGCNLDELLPEAFALTRELADRLLGMRPFDVQVLAGIAMHQGKLVEMQTGEGKTLAAVLPAALRGLCGAGVHILTFNDYLARRDARWMGPIYEALGLKVGTIQEGLAPQARRRAYAADITYATAKEVGFDLLRDSLAYRPEDLVQRPFHFAIVDEADSILIDEARVPLVIACARQTAGVDPALISTIVGALTQGIDFEHDEYKRNVHLTDHGLNRVEAALARGDLHDPGNELLLTEVNQALHVHSLLQKNVDYLIRDNRIEIIDEFTGRAVADRRWPDGLHRALEAKEGLASLPASRILGSISLQHFLALYPRLAGMTATAKPAAEEILSFYKLSVVVIPPNRHCVRQDLPDLVFTHREAKEAALIQEIVKVHAMGRPVLVGTGSVEESEHLAATLLEKEDVHCRVLNARNDEVEAEILAESGAVGAVTISTNMAGRGTDIRLGGSNQEGREQVVSLGGLYVIGTNRHESRRIDDQLRGRAGRQADPGTSRFFVSLEDPLMVRFGIDGLIPQKIRPTPQQAPVDHPVIRREVDRLQRIVEGQNYDIRKALSGYSDLVEAQRKAITDWRSSVLNGEETPDAIDTLPMEVLARLGQQIDAKQLQEIARDCTLNSIDWFWAEHLELVSEVREWIHLVSMGGKNPLHEFHKHIVPPFEECQQVVEDKVSAHLAQLLADDKPSLTAPKMQAPSSTWTYLVNDQKWTGLNIMFLRQGPAFSAIAFLTTWPLLLAWIIWRKLSGKKDTIS